MRIVTPPLRAGSTEKVGNTVLPVLFAMDSINLLRNASSISTADVNRTGTNFFSSLYKSVNEENISGIMDSLCFSASKIKKFIINCEIFEANISLKMLTLAMCLMTGLFNNATNSSDAFTAFMMT